MTLWGVVDETGARLPLNSPVSVIVTVCAPEMAVAVDWLVAAATGLPASDESESSAPDTAALAAKVGECPVAPMRGRLLVPGTTVEWAASPVYMGGLELLGCSKVSIGVNELAAVPTGGPAFIAMRLVAVGAVAAAAGERSSGHTT